MKEKSARYRTYAKVNLFLRVAGRRRDGYHDIETIFHGISLADDLQVSESRGSDEVSVSMTLDGIGGRIPDPQQNLVTRAAYILQRHAGRNLGASVQIVKRIPIAAGLGGGSANAAGALVALNELWGLGLAPGELSDLALEIGSDVPYLLRGGTVTATGRGDRLAPVEVAGTLWFVLGMFDEPLLTEDVYRRWDKLASAGGGSAQEMTAALLSGDVSEIAVLLHNDLEPAAFASRPELAAAKSALLEAGALGAIVSGSGPSVFGLCRQREEAEAVAAAVADAFDRVTVVSSHPVSIERHGH